MRVILDECLPRRLAREIAGHKVSTVPQAGWAGLTNGELLKRIEGRFQAFVTIDRNLAAQQVIGGLSFGVVAIRALSNRLEDLKPPVPEISVALEKLQPGQVIFVGDTV